jgi:hypothetical protein
VLRLRNRVKIEWSDSINWRSAAPRGGEPITGQARCLLPPSVAQVHGFLPVIKALAEASRPTGAPVDEPDLKYGRPVMPSRRRPLAVPD